MKMHKQAHGFAMLEVLIAVAILAFGLLGLAGLQLTGLRNNHSAYLTSQATQQAYDMADRMRSNMTGVNGGAYNNPSAANNTACLTTGGCSTSQLAQFDAYEWNNANANMLPAGAGVVCIDSTPDDGTPTGPACDSAGNLYVIKLWWDDSRSESGLKRFVTSFQP